LEGFHPADLGRTARLRLYDAPGRLLETQSLGLGREVAYVPIHALPPGLYAIELQTDQRVYVARLVVQ
ncbi:MAG: T9SS C-terminal target domain-containing protein, partial [Gammaproteobacteria bacterium]